MGTYTFPKYWVGTYCNVGLPRRNKYTIVLLRHFSIDAALLLYLTIRYFSGTRSTSESLFHDLLHNSNATVEENEC